MEEVQIRLEPRWEAVSACWDECSAHFTRAGLAEDTVYALGIVVQELLENAVKYGVFGTDDKILLTLDVAPGEVVIEVRSPADPSAGRLKKLDDTIQWIRGFQNPFEAYVERLKAVSAAPWVEGQSGLGLARIAYEGRCILDFYVDEHGVLALSATYRHDEGVR